MGLRDEIAQYRMEGSGLVAPQRWPTPDSTGNGVLYTSIYYALLVLRGEARPEDLTDYFATFGPCFDRPGLIDRSPSPFKELDQDSFDDYTGLATASRLMEQDFRYARDILSHGRSTGRIYFTRWVYNNVDHDRWTARSWLGRQPQFVAHLHFAAGEMPNGFLQNAWAESTRKCATDSSAALLQWMRVLAYHGGSQACSPAARSWYDDMSKKWGRIGNILGADLGREHPLARYAID
jgi:hypothetical protein